MRTYFFLSLTLLLFSCGKTENPVLEPPKSSSKEISKSDTIALYKWETDLCSMEANFDPKKYTVKQLDDTYILIFGGMGYGLDMNLHKLPFTQETKEKLDKDYNSLKTKLEKLDVVAIPFWQSLKKQNIEVLEYRYDLYKIILKSQDNPDILLENNFTGKCREYAEALASKDTTVLLAAWKKMVTDDIAQGKSHPDSYNAYTRQYNSENRLRNAYEQVLVYGWYNCSNHQVPYPDATIIYENEFEKLFFNLVSDCMEP